MMKLDILDVFAEAPLAGNQLAVVRNAAPLSPERMQAMALEMNFSETTFVISESEERARVRIFTPTQELPFAGHPTLGTAWVMGRERAHFTLELDSGDVRVEFEDGVAWMTPPPVELRESYPPSEIAAQLGLETSAIHSRLAPQRGDIGLEFLFVGLRSVALLEGLHMTLERLQELPSFGLFAFAPRDDSKIPNFRARMFFESGGLREDPATGSANSIFAAYLTQYFGPEFAILVDQGVEMGRPSRIYLEAKKGGIRVGGKVQSIASGEWTLPE